MIFLLTGSHPIKFMIAKTNPESVLGSLNLRVAGSFFMTANRNGTHHFVPFRR